MAYAAGMNPETFWNATIRDVLMMIKGFNLRENEAWKRLRFSAYITYCTSTDVNKRVPIYQFLELNGDPSPEEIAQIESKQAAREEQELIAAYETAKAQGLI